jgi:hypothetical protein
MVYKIGKEIYLQLERPVSARTLLVELHEIGVEIGLAASCS